jgi:hypothetical protein
MESTVTATGLEIALLVSFTGITPVLSDDKYRVKIHQKREYAKFSGG